MDTTTSQNAPKQNLSRTFQKVKARIRSAARTLSRFVRGVVKECGCGIEYKKAGWLELHHIGDQDFGPGFPVLEMRNCSCGSTLCVEKK